VLEAISKLKLRNSKNHFSVFLLMASHTFDLNFVVFKNYFTNLLTYTAKFDL